MFMPALICSTVAVSKKQEARSREAEKQERGQSQRQEEQEAERQEHDKGQRPEGQKQRSKSTIKTRGQRSEARARGKRSKRRIRERFVYQFAELVDFLGAWPNSADNLCFSSVLDRLLLLQLLLQQQR